MDNYAIINSGPIDNSVLYEQDKHISSDVWNGKERGTLQCCEPTRKPEDAWVLTEQQKELVKKSGLSHLSLIPPITLDRPLISALVEQWRRETNTFHMPIGEMTVTLEDVAYLLGLPIDGKPVMCATQASCDSICLKYLGKSPDSKSKLGRAVDLRWLKDEFCKCPEDASVKEIEFHTRAYLLYLVGTTIFCSYMRTKIQVTYLPLFEDFDRAGEYAWGAAALCYLYRALGNASLVSARAVMGCLTLLQSWSYHHLRIGRPKLHPNLIDKSFPFVLWWKNKHKDPTTPWHFYNNVAFYRKALDSLTLDDVDWRPDAYMMPHTDIAIPQNILLQVVVWGLGRSRTTLICFEKAESHLPDRCLRQFGMPQTIPRQVERCEWKKRRGRGLVDDSGGVRKWETRHSLVIEGVEEEDVDGDEYMKWYLRITRRFVGKPHRLVTLAQGNENCIALFEDPDCPTVEDIFLELEGNNSK